MCSAGLKSEEEQGNSLLLLVAALTTPHKCAEPGRTGFTQDVLNLVLIRCILLTVILQGEKSFSTDVPADGRIAGRQGDEGGPKSVTDFHLGLQSTIS